MLRLFKTLSRPALTALIAGLMLALGATAGSLTPPGAVGSTMHSLANIYDSIASAGFDSSNLTNYPAAQNGSLIGMLKYVENQLAWASGSNNIWSITTGNVGIGTTSPTAKLELSGTASLSNAVYLPNNGNVGIGTNAPGAKMEVRGGGIISPVLSIASSSQSVIAANFGYMRLSGGLGNGGGDSVTPMMRLTNDGDLVNIGKIQAGEAVLTSAGTFASYVSYTTGTGPWSVAARDLNGDGFPDLVTANSADTLSVFLNDGDGTFAAKTDYPTGAGAYNVALGDVNGDGAPDMVSANRSANTVSVFINNRNGTFAAKVDYVTGNTPQGLTVADVTGDGLADIVTANGSTATISMLRNLGNGTFASKVDYAGFSYPYRIAAADMNGDGKQDVVVADFGSRLSVFLNNGNGTFAARVDYASSPLFGVAVADVTGDGKPDVATANYSDNSVSIYRNLGGGVLAAKVDYTIGVVANSVVLGDVNGDGLADMIAGSYNAATVSAFLNNGDGTFAARSDYSTGGAPNPTNDVALADVNGDGKNDIIATEYTATSLVGVFMNQTTTMFRARVAGRVGMVSFGSNVSMSANFELSGTASVGGNTFLSSNASVSGNFETEGHAAIGNLANINSPLINPALPHDTAFLTAASSSATTGFVQGIHSWLQWDPAGAAAASAWAFRGDATIATGNAQDFSASDLTGGMFVATHAGSGDILAVYGAQVFANTWGNATNASGLLVWGGTAQSTGNIASASGIQINGPSSYGAGGNITDAAGIRIAPSYQSAGSIEDLSGIYIEASDLVYSPTITNNYGLYIRNQTGIGANNWNIYSEGDTSRNYFGGYASIAQDLGLTGATSKLIFDGSTPNANKTTLSVVDPTGSRNFYLPNIITTGTSAGSLIARGTNGFLDDQTISTKLILNNLFSDGTDGETPLLSVSPAGVGAGAGGVIGAGDTFGLAEFVIPGGLTSTTGGQIYGLYLQNSNAFTVANESAVWVLGSWDNILELEGPTNDTFETNIRILDPTTDGTIFIPRNLSGVFALVSSGSQQPTNAGNFWLLSPATTSTVASISALSLTSGDVFKITVPASTSTSGRYLLVQDVNGVAYASLGNGGRLSLARDILSDGSFNSCTGPGAPNPGCIDYAESFPTTDDTLSAGELVSVDPQNPSGVIRAADSASVLGVISTNPATLITGFGVLGGSSALQNPKDTVPIALAGRVPVKLKGSVAAGDHLALSDTPGVAEKATSPGMTVGIALEDSSGPTVMTFVNTSYWAPDIGAVQSGSTVTFGDREWSFDYFFGLIVDAFKRMFGIEFGQGRVRADQLCAGTTCVNSEQLQRLLDVVGGSVPTATPTPSDSSAPVITENPSPTPTDSSGPIVTESPSPTPSDIPTPTTTPSETPVPTPDATPTPSVDVTPAVTP